MARRRALVVDDSDISAAPVRSFLESRSIPFDRAYSAQEAAKKLSSDKYGLVFLDLDLNLGGQSQDGIGVLSWMRDNNRSVPTVIVSEAAHITYAIRAQQTYPFVLIRLTQDQVRDLGDLLDQVIRAFAGQAGSIYGRTATSVFAVGLSALATLVALILRNRFAEVPREATVGFTFVVFAAVCSLVYVFGAPVVESAVKAFPSIIGARRQLQKPKR